MQRPIALCPFARHDGLQRPSRRRSLAFARRASSRRAAIRLPPRDGTSRRTRVLYPQNRGGERLAAGSGRPRPGPEGSGKAAIVPLPFPSCHGCECAAQSNLLESPERWRALVRRRLALSPPRRRKGVDDRAAEASYDRKLKSARQRHGASAAARHGDGFRTNALWWLQKMRVRAQSNPFVIQYY